MRTVSLKISFLMAFTPVPDVMFRETGSLAGWKRLFENAERALSDNGVRTGRLRSVRNAIAG